MSMTFDTNVVVNNGKSVQTNKVLAPTASGGSTYGAGTSGQVLTSNGTGVYWADAASGATGSAFTDIGFTIATADWTLTNGEYIAEITNNLFTASAGVDVFYDRTFRTAVKSDIYTEKTTGKVTFSTSKVPVSSVSGTIRVFDGQVALTPSSVQTVIALASGWTGNEAPYTQTVSANGVTATNNIIVGIGTVTNEQKISCENANILCTAQGDNSVTFTAYTWKPEVNIPINIMIVG